MSLPSNKKQTKAMDQSVEVHPSIAQRLELELSQFLIIEVFWYKKKLKKGGNCSKPRMAGQTLIKLNKIKARSVRLKGVDITSCSPFLRR